MKDGNWIPLDKNLVHFLPRDRPYTILEAMFSFRVDMDNEDEKSEIAYSRIWSWSRSKVRRFITDLKTGTRHAPDSRETGKRHEVCYKFNNLGEAKDRQKTGKRQAKDRGETGTINPNPNPKEKTIDVPYDEIVNLYNSICVSLPKCRGISDGREKTIRARWKESGETLSIFQELFAIAENTPFLRGKNDRQWKADIDFLMTAGKFNRVLEGKYGDQICKEKEKPAQPAWL